MVGLNSWEDDELAEIELTYSLLDDINQARPAFGRPAVCIIQVHGCTTPMIPQILSDTLRCFTYHP